MVGLVIVGEVGFGLVTATFFEAGFSGDFETGRKLPLGVAAGPVFPMVAFLGFGLGLILSPVGLST